MITFFHTADIHFGVENYGKIDPTTGIHSRLLDFKKSLDLCIDQAIAEKIDFFLFSGDAYKTAYPTPTQQKLLMSSLLRLQQAKIPIVIIVGNHDHPLSFGKAHALDVFSQLPLEGFHVFSRPSILNLETQHGIIQIVGIPWPTRNTVIAHTNHASKTHEEVTNYIAQQIGEIIKQLAAKLDPTLPAVLAGHLTVSNGVFSGSEKCAVYGTDPMLLPSQLAIPPFDYVGLGHLHRYQNLNPGGYPALVYSGSIDRVDFGERKETKGFVKVSITIDNQKKNCTHTFIPLATRPFIQIDVSLDSTSVFTEQIIAAINKESIVDAIVKITYTLPPGAQDNTDLSKILKACQTAMAVANVTAIHQPLQKEQRATLKKNMSLTTLMQEYFMHKGIDRDQIDTLQEKAEGLITEYNNEEQQQ